MPTDMVDTGVTRIWTIGHSTRSREALLGLLGEYRIEAIADVRRYPGSRHYPYFALDALSGILTAHGIYQWLPRYRLHAHVH